jgi:hypothetical protein
MGVLNSSADELHYVVVRKTGHALGSARATSVDTTDSLRGVSRAQVRIGGVSGKIAFRAWWSASFHLSVPDAQTFLPLSTA